MYKVNISVRGIELHSNVSRSCCTIFDSYKLYKSKDIVQYVQELRNTLGDPMLSINQRDFDSMVREWKAHNILYTLNIQKERTKSVDLETNQSKVVSFGWRILSWAYPFYELIKNICN